MKTCRICGEVGEISLEGKGQIWRGQSYSDPQYWQLNHWGKLDKDDDFPKCFVELRGRSEEQLLEIWNKGN
jgi:hypothetical protein